MTEEIFRNDAYTISCEASVVDVDEDGIELDRTVFYPMGGGQPGDTGVLRAVGSREVVIVDTIKSRVTGRQLHVPSDGAPALVVGDAVTAKIDWGRRHKLMRMHSTLHLLCALIDSKITGAQVGVEKSRIDFNLPDKPLDKDHISAELNRLIGENRPMSAQWITDEELASKPDLIRTMSVKPPTGVGRVRLVAIEGVDLQPCGGTHVSSTGEIGRIRVGKIENKGKHNRRINVHLDD
ncbi:MAG: Alanine--tRNA ligase [Alphaproteobacteria bacterium MarineAlpha3_Bin4]|nr:MAG: Alanine--tRNA ligase [Alphaproteobacteria bacterium MarineAlpha3_Bin4]